jgi:hypothetical protein
LAREKTYSEVLNLRIDPVLQREIRRIAEKRGASESDTARLLMTWGVEAHRAMEAKELLRRYDAPSPEYPMRMVIDVRWEEDEWEPGDVALPSR